MAERLQKFLAQAGYGSRREIENWIREGRISVNEKPAELGVSVTAEDRIRVDGRLVAAASQTPRPPRTMAYHKPAGELTTRKDAEGRPTVFDNLPKIRSGRWISVGRLDFNTAGLLLVTTDGELAHRLMHPSWEIEREYAVRVLGEVDEAILQQLQEGVMLEDGMAAFASIKDAGGQGVNHWYHVTVREGRNREVRRLWESQGLQVSRLIRIRFGPVSLQRSLRAGRFQDLATEELAALYAAVKLPVPEAPPRRRRAEARHGRRRREISAAVKIDRRRLSPLFATLLRTWGPQHWWPGETPFEVMVGAVLTQNTAWTNVEKAISNLVARDWLDADRIAGLRQRELASSLKPSGYFNIKAQRLQAFCRWYRQAGGYAVLAQLPTAELREALLAVKGIGPETADDMLLYAFDRPVFVVDAYTRRLFSRFGLCVGDEPYEQLRNAVETAMGADVDAFNELHALIVRHAKEVCRVKPRCADCVLARRCPAACAARG